MSDSAPMLNGTAPPSHAGRFHIARAIAAIDPEFRPIFFVALRHLQQPDRQAVRALISEFRRLSIAADAANAAHAPLSDSAHARIPDDG